jgi:hypothetical protein
MAGYLEARAGCLTTIPDAVALTTRLAGWMMAHPEDRAPAPLPNCAIVSFAPLVI